MNSTIQIALATTGIINCFLGAIFLFFVKRGNHKSNILLAFLSLAICLKLGYALLINIPHQFGLPSLIFYYFTEAGYISIGPLLFLYFLTLVKKEAGVGLTILVLIPALAPFIAHFLRYDISLGELQAYFLIFLIAIFLNLKDAYADEKKKFNKSEKLWMNTMYASFVFIWLAVNLLFIDYEYYFFELSIIFTAIFYINFCIAIKHYWLRKGDIVEPLKYRNSSLTEAVENEVLSKLEKLMEYEKHYIDPEISLPKVAGKINCKPHILSQVINQKMNMTFNEYINSYRVRDIMEVIKLPEYQQVKIASIAFDYGFNSISSFNTAFKKITDYTPSQFRMIK